MTNPSPSAFYNSETYCLIFYAGVLLTCLSTIAATFTQYPLFPLDTQSLAWSNAWLLATTIDYYGTCLCFCGVIISSEESWRSAILWVISCCVVKSPACCLYVFLWLTKEGVGSLRLERASTGGGGANGRTGTADADETDADSTMMAMTNPTKNNDTAHTSTSTVVPLHHHHRVAPNQQYQSRRHRDIERGSAVQVHVLS